jgi:hypothetical protein
MLHIKIRDVFAFCCLMFGLSGWVYGACEIGADTNATSVQADSGNGDYQCDLWQTLKGIPLEPVPAVLATPENEGEMAVRVTIDPVTGRLSWTVPQDADGNALLDVDLASVARNSGKRCNYGYSGDQEVEGAGLSTSDDGTVTLWTFCADGEIGTTAVNIEPETTVADACDATFVLDDGTVKPGLSLGYTKNRGDGYEGVQVCGSGQHRCINECVPRDTTGANCTLNPADGTYSTDCAPCEWDYPDPVTSPDDLKYCWYYQNKVCVDKDEDGVADSPFCNSGRTLDTFKESPLKKVVNASIGVSTGSDECTVTVGPLYGGLTYTYFVSPCSP